MSFKIKNVTMSVTVSLTVLKMTGLWIPRHLEGTNKLLYYCYTVLSIMFFLGIYIITQLVDLFLIWGNIPLMTATAFLLFTNLAHFLKILNLLIRRDRIQDIVNEGDGVLSGFQAKEELAIVKSCNKEMAVLQATFYFITVVTAIGWMYSTEKGELLLRAWYPYDTKKSPAYELTYLQQVAALLLAATTNLAKDTLVVALIAQCRCRMHLISHTLKNMGKDLQVDDKNKLTASEEASMNTCIRWCVKQHQEALQATNDVQACFSGATFAQFTVSLIIICVSAFQMLEATGNIVRLLSMSTYLLNMSYQVFIYCYQGNQLTEQSLEIADAAYWCPWYKCSVRLRRSVLIIMVRTRQVAKIMAGGFTTLSLASFMSIIKASYSLFTLLKQVTD